MERQDKGNCSTGTYCSNSEGSFSCVDCDPACEKEEGCTGAGSGHCVECAEGYTRENKESPCEGPNVVSHMSFSTVVDVDECLDESRCPVGKYCFNMPGDHRCYGIALQLSNCRSSSYIDCDMSCDATKGCTGSGATKCVACAAGYAQDSTGFCKGVTVANQSVDVVSDVDECETSPCQQNEECHNTVGSFECKAKEVAGLVFLYPNIANRQSPHRLQKKSYSLCKSTSVGGTCLINVHTSIAGSR